jgi:hypothetical protein
MPGFSFQSLVTLNLLTIYNHTRLMWVAFQYFLVIRRRLVFPWQTFDDVLEHDYIKDFEFLAMLVSGRSASGLLKGLMMVMHVEPEVRKHSTGT